MRAIRVRIAAVSTALVIGHFLAVAGTLSDEWFDENCVGGSAKGWCEERLRERGWTLKSKNENPRDLQDLYWRQQVWVKGSDVLLCAMVRKEGAIVENGCKPASESPASK